MSKLPGNWIGRAACIGALFSCTAFAQGDGSLPWLPAPLPGLEGLRQQSGIDPGLLRLNAGALADKQKALPDRYDLRARHYTVLGDWLRGKGGHAVFTTGTVEYRALGEGFVLQRLLHESDDGAIKGESELVSWLGMIPVAQHIAANENGLVSIATGSAAHFSGTPPDPARLLPGATFAFQVDLEANATRYFAKGRSEQQQSVAKRAYACTVGQPLEAARIEASFTGRALPISCQVNESGTTSESTFYYLENYAVAVPGWLGGTREPMEGESLVWYGRRGTFGFHYTWQAGLRAWPPAAGR